MLNMMNYIFSDDLYCGGMNSLVGLNNNNNNNDDSNKQNTLSICGILDGVSSLISCKMVLSDDLLILCAVYSEYCNNNSYVIY